MESQASLTRRTMMQSTLAALAAACAPRVPRLGTPVERVLVLGAGVSGLTAAHSLRRAGIDVLVLEGRDRIGGRTFTDSVGKARVDLGAAWVHGVVHNPIARILEDRGRGVTEHFWQAPRVFDGNGERYGSIEGEAFYSEIEDFVRAVPRLSRELGPGATLASGIDLHVKGASGSPSNREGLHRLLTAFVEINLAGPADRQRLEGFFRETAFAGGEHFPIGGYSELVDILAEGADVRLSDPVSTIGWATNGVTARTASGAEHTCSHCIVTLPVGVLQSGRVTFEPGLPQWKRAALDRLEMGNLEKVVLTFDEPFWRPGLRRDALVTLRGDGSNPVFFDVADDAGAPALVVLYAGTWARTVQALDPAEAEARLVSDALATLRSVYDDVPDPVATRTTHWTTDPFALGSYAFLPVGATRDDLDTLADPVDDRLLFAGDATVRAYTSQVPGAFLSGLREAARLGGLPWEAA